MNKPQKIFKVVTARGIHRNEHPIEICHYTADHMKDVIAAIELDLIDEGVEVLEIKEVAPAYIQINKQKPQ